MTRLSERIDGGLVVAPSLVWTGSSGDFALAPAADPVNPAGLLADAPLLSAIALCLFSDGRGEADPIDPAAIDLRGWPGDGFDIDRAAGETPLGNPAWTLFRRPVNAETARLAERYMTAALQPLIDQGLLGSVAITARPLVNMNAIEMIYHLTRVDGTALHSGPWAGLLQKLKG